MQRVNEESKPCDWCGVTLSRNRFNGRLEDLSVFRRRRFCSISCAKMKKQVGWSMLHKRARAHLKQCCETCGGTNLLAAHHKDKTTTNNDPSNIQTLCVHCHARHHHGTLATWLESQEQKTA